MSKYSDAADQLFSEDTAQEQPAAPVSTSKYGAAADAVFGAQDTQLRSSVMGAAGKNPDQVAKAAALGRKTGVPAMVAERNLQEVERTALVDDLDKMTADTPAVRRAYADQYIASAASDDGFSLTKIERGLREFLTGGQRVKPFDSKAAYKNTAQRFDLMTKQDMEDMKYGVLKAPEGVAPTVENIVKGIAQSIPQRFDAVREGARMQMGDMFEALGILKRDPVQMADAQRKLARAQGASQFTTPEFETTTGQGLYGGAVSTAQNLTSLVAAVMTRNPTLGLSMIGAETQADAYGKYRTRGGTPGESFVGGTAEAAIEVGTELLPMRVLSEKLGRAGVGDFLKSYLARDLPTEQLATVLQDAVDTAIANPNKTWGEYLSERPEAAYQTLLGTLVQAGTMGAASVAVGKAQEQQAREYQDTQQKAQALQEIMATAAGSKLRERDPTTFREVVQAAAEEHDGAPKSVFVDGQVLLQTLQQAGVTDEQLDQLLPSVRAQLADAAGMNAPVEIPIGELVSAVPGSPLEQALVPHIRATADGLSPFEAEQAQEQAQEFLQGEATRVMQASADSAQFSVEAEAVRENIKQQLDATGRFSSDVTGKYATLVRDFYTVMSSRTGMTPAQMYQALPYKVNAQGQSGGVLNLNQITPEQAMDTNVPVEMPTDEAFTTAVANTPGAQVTENGLLIDLVRFQKPEQEGAQAVRTGVFYLPAKSADARHYRNAKTGYGGSERFNAPTLIRRPLFVKGATGGAAPEQAYRQLKGKEALAELSRDVTQVITRGGNYMRPDPALKRQLIEEFLSKYAPEREGYGGEIYSVSTEGNTLRYALQELAVAAAVREAGYDAVVGYSNKKTGPAISEVFDVREQTFPARGMDSQVHEAFEQSAKGEDIGAKLMARVQNDFEATVKEYDALPESNGGQIINTDIARELSPEYREDRTRSAEVHDAASTLMTRLYTEKLAQPVPEGRAPVVLFTAGGTGAGKSTGLELMPELAGEANLIYDGTMSKLKGAVDKIEQALAAGRDVQYMYVYRDPAEALQNGALPRAVRSGRTAPLQVLQDSHTGARAVAEALAEKYKDDPRVQFIFVDNSHGKGNAKVVALANIPQVPDNGLKEKLNEILDQEYQAGNISDAVYSGTKKPVSAAARSAGDDARGVQPEAGPAVRGQLEQGRNKYQVKYLAGRDVNALSSEERAQYDALATPVTETEAFKKWFGDSKVVDADGKPLVVYHGSAKDFTAFDKRFLNGENGRSEGAGFYFTSNKQVAEGYASGRLFDVFLSIQKPLPYDAKPFSKAQLQKIILRAADLEAAAEETDIRDGFLSNWGDTYSATPAKVAAEAAAQMADEALALDQLGGLMGAGLAPDVVNQALQETLGFDGYSANGFSNAGEKGDTIYIAFNPEQIKSATGNDGTFDVNDPSILSQGPRGTFSPSTLTTVLNESADLSTFLHETGHFFLEAMAYLAAQPTAAQSVRDDMNALLKWFGVQDLDTWRGMSLEQQRKHHERFAESFEQYLLEGKAPSVELASLFRTFRAWLTRVYRSLSEFMDGRDLQFSDDIRQVMDRMLATEEQIAEAEKVAGLVPELDATGEAIEKLQARSIRDLKWAVNARNKVIKQLQAEAKEKRKAMTAEVTAEVNEMPQVKAKAALDAIRKETRTAPSDMAMGVVADANGYADTTAMLEAIDMFGRKADVIEGMTDQRMLERYGDLTDQASIEQAATEAVHNAARAKSLATELAAQRELLNPRADTGKQNAKGQKVTVNALVEAAKQFAANVIGRRKLADLKKAAWGHLQAERRASKAWEEATAKGDTKAAVQAKQDQMLNHYAVKAANDAQDQVKKSMELFAKVTKGNNEKLVERGYDPDVANAARAILAMYGVGVRGEKGAMEYLSVLEKNDPAMFSAVRGSIEAAVDQAKPLDQLTVTELEALTDEIKSLWHLARRSRQSEIDGNLIDRTELEEKMKERLEAIGIPDTMPGDMMAITPMEQAVRLLSTFRAAARRVESWVGAMDGSEVGPFTRYAFQPVKEAADRYRADKAKFIKRYRDLLDNIEFKRGTIVAPELGYVFGRDTGGIAMSELLHAILHTGNASNKRKLLLGRGWATENEDGTLNTTRWDNFITRMILQGVIGKEHYDFAQGVWDLLEETKPLAQKTHRDVFGRYFAEVTADAFDTPFGRYKGGYAPAMADSRIVSDAATRTLAEAENDSMAYAFPATSRGFTKGRVDYNRPLMLDLRTLAQHIDKVLLFSHLESPVRDVRKLLTAKGVAYGLNRIDPVAFDNILTPWLNRASRQQVETPVAGAQGLMRVFTAARTRAGMAAMFANVANSAQQITGFAVAATKVKPTYLISAAAQMIASPKQMAQSVGDASVYMKERMENDVANAESAVRDILLDPNVYEKAKNWSAKHAYFLQQAVDNAMSPAIWTAAFNQSVAEGMSDKDAVRYADSVVRTTQGSTLPEDVSRIEGGNAFVRMFTQFGGYFNMLANLQATELGNIAREVGVKNGAGKMLYVVLMGFLAQAWVGEAIMQAFKGGPDDEDKDGEYLDDWLAAVFGWSTLRGMTAMVPVAGQITNAAVNATNSKPYDDRIGSSPAISMIESSVRAPVTVYKAIVDEGNRQKAVRDVATMISMMTGIPVSAAAKPLGYMAGVSQGKIDPTGPVDTARGLMSGVASPQSK